MMNILLVSPQTPRTFWSFQHVLRIAGRKAAFPPLGLLTVAALLPPAWKLRLVDLNVRPLSDADIDQADAVFLSAMIVQEPSVRAVLARCRARGKPVVAGGPLFTTGAARFPEATCCAVGEAEDIMPALIADLAEGRLQARYQADGKPDVTRTPLPRWDLIHVHDYITLSIQTSRGCPFDCEFCDITAVYGRVPRVKTPAQVIRELEAVRATGWRGGVFVVDDNFIGNRAKAKELLRALIAWRTACGCRCCFTTEASMNLVDDAELLQLMVRAGFRNVFIGIESPAESSLNECGKVQNTGRDLRAAVRKLHNSGLQVMAGFIVGFDHDQPDIFEQQQRFIRESGVVTAMVGLLTALPGTRLFTRLTREGRIVRASTGNNLDGVLNFVPVMEPETLREGYRRLVQRLYEPREFYQRVLTFLRDYRPAAGGMNISLGDLRAFLRSLWVIGLRAPGRLHYWKFLLRAWWANRRAFPTAVELAIRGYHFRAIAARL